MKDIKVLHICTIDKGGAFNGARRQHEMLLEYGMESKILVRTKQTDNSEVFEALGSGGKLVSKAKNLINLLLKRGEVKRDRFGTDLTNNQFVKDADIIILHWISTFLSPKEIYVLSKIKNKKIIFFMHDMWLFTGGCHVDRRCGGYVDGCKKCPMAGAAAARSFKYKKKYLAKTDMLIAGPSHWIVDEAKKSSLLEGKEIVYLPNTYDSKVFYPRENTQEIREKYGFSKDKKIILFGAADTGTANSNKGFGYLLDALKQIDMSDIQLVVIGNANGIHEVLTGYDVVTPGFVKDENKLAEIYSAADVFVNPSLQESFGYTVCESMACGTAVVAFAVGGMLDQISHMENGYLAEYQNSNDLAKGINECLSNYSFSFNAAESAKRFDYSEVIKIVDTII